MAVPRTVGVIQGHGFLIGIDPGTSAVEVVSANLSRFLGVDAPDALGMTLLELVGPEVLTQLPPPQPAGGSDTPALVVRLPPNPSVASPASSGRQRWDEFEVVAHHAGDWWVFEFEPSVGTGPTPATLHESFRQILDRLRTVQDAIELCAVAAREVRTLTGHDRVLVFRFDDVSQAEVVAEATGPSIESSLGLTFPSTAILPATRTLYLRGLLRLVSDVDDARVPLLTSPGSAVSASLLRSDFDVDVDQLRGLGIAAVMTVPILVDGRLWGLLACHHQTPYRVSRAVRDSCEMLSRVLSFQIRAAELRVEQSRAATLNAHAETVAATIAEAEELDRGAADVTGDLLAMVGADGVVFEIAGRRITAGVVPREDRLDALVARIGELAGNDVPPWTTDALPALIGADGAGLLVDGRAVGVLYLPFGGPSAGYGLWLRGEEVRPVTWAEAVPPSDESDPGADAGAADAGAAGPAAGAPGRRFTIRRREDVLVGRSRSWLAAEHAAASLLARALPPVLLHRAQRKLADQQLAVTEERLQVASQLSELEHQLHQHQRLESLGQLAGGVAHDFNNLLAVIGNYLDFIGDAVDARTGDDPTWREVQADIDQVKSATNRAGELTRQLLAFARREVTHPRALNLDHVLAGLEPLLRRTLGEQLDLRIDLDGNLPLVLADPGQMEQVLVNLAVNARDAMPTGGTLTIRTTDLSSGGVGGGSVRLLVADTGTGVPPEILDRVFDPFFSTKPRDQGTGLGLATVHGIVTGVGGVIEVDSTVGTGTTFTMVFPTTDSAPPAAADRVGHPVGREPGGTVLFVEDSAELREVGRRVLAGAGYTVLTAANGYEALEVAARQSSSIDLLVTDMVMPFMTGDEVAARLRRLIPELPVLLMSGYAEPLLVPDRADDGDALLKKPFTRSELRLAVLEALDRASRPTADAGPSDGG